MLLPLPAILSFSFFLFFYNLLWLQLHNGNLILTPILYHVTIITSVQFKGGDGCPYLEQFLVNQNEANSYTWHATLWHLTMTWVWLVKYIQYKVKLWLQIHGWPLENCAIIIGCPAAFCLSWASRQNNLILHTDNYYL